MMILKEVLSLETGVYEIYQEDDFYHFVPHGWDVREQDYYSSEYPTLEEAIHALGVWNFVRSAAPVLEAVS